jgi:hypothetical protein
MEEGLNAKNICMNIKSILALDFIEARKFFLKGKNYCNFDLPFYFTFDELLLKLSDEISSSDVSGYFEVDEKNNLVLPKNLEKVNHIILANKDGEFAWRPYEIIHPVLYVGLVHLLTDRENWNFLVNKFKQFSKTSVQCESIPCRSETSESDKAEQVKKWWKKVEQESVKLGLDFKYVLDTDISDCYGSIYTHSISWALHTKPESKAKRGRKQLLGNEIDWFIQMMRFGQTNGIPQGSAVMDFIAEMILGHVDELLIEKVTKLKIKKSQYKIIRYRDDYKIFVNEPQMGIQILKSLSEVLSQLGIKLNTAKTKQHSDPILASIKEDKIDELFVPDKKENFSKWLFQIYATASKHPNSGKVARQLCVYHDVLKKHKDENKKLEYYEDPEVMISIIVNLAIKSPKYYNWCMSIVSILITYILGEYKKIKIIKRINKKFCLIPNTGLLDIWLHRVSSEIDPSITYGEVLTSLTSSPYPGNSMWCCDWLKSSLKEIVMSTSIVDMEKFSSKSVVMSREEVALFNKNYIW